LFEHDLFGKPVSTFPDHARAVQNGVFVRGDYRQRFAKAVNSRLRTAIERHPMPSANDYFKMAEECYRLANEAKTEVDRLACLDLARTWIEAAAQQDEAEKRTRESPPEPRH
jgi:hypothetical protein